MSTIRGSQLRIGGLNSGLDTEAIVNAMTASTKLRITTNQRKVLKLESQQEAYRSIIGKFDAFKNKYFDILNRDTWLGSRTTFNRHAATISMNGQKASPAGVRVTTGNNATAGNYTVTVNNVATQASVTSSAVDSSSSVFNPSDYITSNASLTATERRDVLEGLGIDTTDADLSTTKKTNAFLATLSETQRNAAREALDDELADKDPAALKTFSMSVTVGGTTRLIAFSGEDKDAVIDSINAQLRTAFGSTNSGEGMVYVEEDDGNLKFISRERRAISTGAATELSDSINFNLDNIETGNNSITIVVGGETRTVSFQTVSNDYFNNISSFIKTNPDGSWAIEKGQFVLNQPTLTPPAALGANPTQQQRDDHADAVADYQKDLARQAQEREVFNALNSVVQDMYNKHRFEQYEAWQATQHTKTVDGVTTNVDHNPDFASVTLDRAETIAVLAANNINVQGLDNAALTDAQFNSAVSNNLLAASQANRNAANAAMLKAREDKILDSMSDQQKALFFAEVERRNNASAAQRYEIATGNAFDAYWAANRHLGTARLDFHNDIDPTKSWMVQTLGIHKQYVTEYMQYRADTEAARTAWIEANPGADPADAPAFPRMFTKWLEDEKGYDNANVFAFENRNAEHWGETMFHDSPLRSEYNNWERNWKLDNLMFLQIGYSEYGAFAGFYGQNTVESRAVTGGVGQTFESFVAGLQTGVNAPAVLSPQQKALILDVDLTGVDIDDDDEVALAVQTHLDNLGGIGDPARDAAEALLVNATNPFSLESFAHYFNESSIRNTLNNVTFSDGVRINADIVTDPSSGAITGITVTAGKQDGDDTVNVPLGMYSNSGNDFGQTQNIITANTISGSTRLNELGLEADANGNFNFTINGVDFSFAQTSTISSMMNIINSNQNANVNMTFSTLTNTFEIKSKDFGTAAGITIGKVTDDASDMGDKQNLLSTLGFTVNGTTVQNGSNMSLTVNGLDVETTSNSYTVNGTTITIGENAVLGPEGTFNIEVMRDTSRMMDIIKDFVRDYNELIDYVFGYTNDKPDPQYFFLTDNDREELNLSETQENRWMDKAKKGLLYNDRTLIGIMGRMRTTMFTGVPRGDGTQFGLFSMGITTSNNWRQNGKLVIDENKLEEAINGNIELITELFTNAEKGLMPQLQTVIDSAISPRGQRWEQGLLVQRAGISGGASERNNAIYDQIKRINDTVSRLELRYQRQQDRFWKIFSSLEQQMGVLNSQGDHMAGLMSSMMGRQQ